MQSSYHKNFSNFVYYSAGFIENLKIVQYQYVFSVYSVNIIVIQKKKYFRPVRYFKNFIKLPFPLANVHFFELLL